MRGEDDSVPGAGDFMVGAVSTFDGVPDAVWLLNAGLEIVYANHAAERLSGCSAGELIGAEAASLHPSSAAGEVEGWLRRVLAGEPRLWEGHILRPDGTLLATELHAAPVAGRGERIRVVIVARDVSAWVEGREQAQTAGERLQLLVENAPDIIVTCDAEGRFASVNLAAEDLSGYPRRQLQSMTWRDLVTPDSADALTAFARAASGATPAPFELTLSARDGLRAILEMRVWPLTQDGAPAGYQGIGRNVTERKEAEEAAQRSRRESEVLASIAQELTQSLERDEVLRRVVERARTLSHSDLSAIAVPDNEGFTFLAEDGMQAAGLGASVSADHGPATELLAAGRPVAMRRYLDEPVLDARIRPHARAEDVVSMALAPVRLNGEVAALIYVGTRHEREYTATDLQLLARVAHLSAATLRNASLFTDAETANRALEEALGRANALAVEAEQAAEVKAQFLATTSHEIRTPLSGVIGMLDLLRETPLNDEQDEYVGVAHSSANDLLELINDILDFSKIEAGRLTLESVEFDLRQLVEDTVTLLSTRARERGLALVFFVDPALHGPLGGDPARLRQVLLNLIGNAVKFTEEGSVEVRASVAEERGDTIGVRFSVQDTGIGLSPGARRRLFEPFTQADGSTTRTYGGTGLGLAISRRLVDLMGGEIDVESVQGKGSTFWFTAPLARTAPAAVESQRLLGRRVLFVDDLRAVHEAVASYLRVAGARVAVAADGEEALAVLRAAPGDGGAFEAVLVDLALPGIDGFELAARVQGDPSLRGTRLILLTVFNDPGQGERAHQGGFDAFLAEPVRGAVLTDTVARVLNPAGAIPAPGGAPARDPEPRAVEAASAGALGRSPVRRWDGCWWWRTTR